MSVTRRWPRDYFRISFMSKEALEHYREAARHYKAILDRAWSQIQAHQNLLALLDENERRSLPIGVERDTTDRMIAHLAELIERAQREGGDVNFVEVSRDWIGWVKSVCRLYEGSIRRDLDQVERVREMPAAVISSLRARLAQLAEKTSLGVFAEVDPTPLVIEDLVATEPPRSGQPPEAREGGEPQIPDSSPSPPPVTTAPPILDIELRERTLDLYSIFESRALEERYDTILREIGAVVEDRLRNACGAPPEKIGVELASYAFGGQTPRIRLSLNAAEQEGVHLLFRGFFGWVRNPAGHRLLGKVSKERVLQVLGLADYLLGLLGEGQAAEERSREGESGDQS